MPKNFDFKSNQIEKKYMTESEASIRYSLSKQWFQRERWKGSGPSFIKVNGSGRILYPIEQTDTWFEKFTNQNTSVSN